MNEKTEYKSALILTMVLGLLLIAPAQVVAESQTSSVIIQEYKITPSVLMPGEKGTLTVVLKSTASGTQTSSVTTGKDTASTTSPVIPYVESVTFTSKDITLLSTDSEFHGNIGPDQAIPVTFLIQAPKASGLYFPEVWIHVRDGQNQKYPIPVNVNTQLSVMKTPSLTLDNTFPNPVKPGTKINGSLRIRNEGSSQADNVQISLNGTPPVVIPSGINSFQIDGLKSGEEVSRNISLLVSKNAETGLVNNPVQIEYALLDGTHISQTGNVGLDIRGESELGITSVETTPSRVTPDQPFNLIVRVQNTGTGDAKTVSATIDLPVQGAKEAFIGKIKQGNDAPATFILEGAKPGEYPYTVVITYTDDWGERTIEKKLTLTVPKSEDTSGVILIIVILVIGAGAGYWYIRRKKEEN